MLFLYQLKSQIKLNIALLFSSTLNYEKSYSFNDKTNLK